jgi:ElaB/YqjD/DUF883 family membrane-anchored ribosome-binding protein
MTKPDPENLAENLAEQIAQLRTDMARIAETLASMGQTKQETLRASLSEQAEALRSQGAEKLDDVTAFARTNPAQAMAMAGGIGLLLGLMFGRR